MRTCLFPVIAVFIHSVDFGLSQISAEVRSVGIGGCYDSTYGVFVHCAAVEEECEDSARIRFKTANELTELGIIGKCTTMNLPLGTCANTGECAITKDSCDDPNEFVPPEPVSGRCNAEGSYSNGNFIPTQYGACKDGTTGEIICALTPDDCDVTEAWIPASVALLKKNGGCRCDDVRVGVCNDGPYIDPMLSQCAISPDDCHPLVQTFDTARNVIDHALLDCRLCLPNKPKQEILDTELAELESKKANDDAEEIKLEKAEESTLSRGGMTGIIVGVSCLLVTLTIVVLVWRMKRTEDETDSQLDVPSIS